MLKKPCVFVMLVIQVMFLALKPVTVFAQVFPYQFKYLTVDEGLSHTDANDIAQDHKGYIWVGTFFGLDRFDGYTIKKYYNSNVPLQNAFKNRIRCLYPEQNGMIWLGTEEGVQCFNSRTEKYIDFQVGPGESKVIFSRILKLPGNRICGISGGKLKLYKINRTTLVSEKLGLPGNVQITGMIAGPGNQVFLSSNNGLFIMDVKGKCSAITVQNLPNTIFTGVFGYKRGNLLLIEHNKLFKVATTLTKTAGVVTRNFQLKETYVFKEETEIKDVVQGRTDFWVNTGGELVRLDGSFKYIQTISNRSSHAALNSGSLNRLLVDRSECLWVGTFGGGVNYCDLN